MCAGTSYGNVRNSFFDDITVHSSKKKFWFLDGQLVLLGGSRPPPQALSFRSLWFSGGGGGFRGTGSFRLRRRRVRGGRGRPHAGSSPSRMVFRCPGGGKVNLLFVEPSLHLGEEEGERAAQREGGRRLAGRAGRRKQESRGGATGERGRSCQ